MRPHRLRSLGVALLAIAGAALLGAMSVMRAAFAFGDDVALIMDGTFTPTPDAAFVTHANQVYIAPFFPGYTPQALTTPEQFAPFTGLTSEGLDTSISGGVTDLNTAVTQQLADGNNVVVFGLSQSSAVATVYQDDLAALPADERPSPDQLSFVLTGDPDNPDGGLFERLAPLNLPAVDATAFGAAPDDLYPTVIYTGQYDGFADFPQYPLNFLADLNALLGAVYVHSEYPHLTAAQIATGVVEPVTSADTDTTYILIPTQTLPLLDPLEGILPAPLLDLIEPPLRDLINLGYDPDAPANVPAPAQLFPTDINAITAVVDFARSVGQGVNDFLAAEGLPSLPNLPVLTELTNDLLTSPLATITFTLPDVTVPVPPQIADVIDGPLNDLVSALNTVNDEIDPAITSAIYGAGSTLATDLTAAGAPAELTNAIDVGAQVWPILIERPGNFVVGGIQLLVTGVEDLAAGNLSGFGQELQSIGADDIIGVEFLAALDIVALAAIATDTTFGIGF